MKQSHNDSFVRSSPAMKRSTHTGKPTVQKGRQSGQEVGSQDFGKAANTTHSQPRKTRKESGRGF